MESDAISVDDVVGVHQAMELVKVLLLQSSVVLFGRL